MILSDRIKNILTTLWIGSADCTASLGVLTRLCFRVGLPVVRGPANVNHKVKDASGSGVSHAVKRAFP